MWSSSTCIKTSWCPALHRQIFGLVWVASPETRVVLPTPAQKSRVDRKGEHPLLKLKRVELQGFKSFCDRSEMRFHGAGIAAVVGPNGCGKSNLSDAISWVLGEQSAKSLRGSRMEDVIFAGTRDRKPVGMASVTMTMVDPTVHAEFPVHAERQRPRQRSCPCQRQPGTRTIKKKRSRSPAAFTGRAKAST